MSSKFLCIRAVSFLKLYEKFKIDLFGVQQYNISWFEKVAK